MELGIKPKRPDPTLDFYYSEIFNYDVVILITHGGILTNDERYYLYDKDGDPIHTYLASDELGSDFTLGEIESGDEIVDKWREKFNELAKDKEYKDAFEDEDAMIKFTWVTETRKVPHTWVAYPRIPENFFKYYSKGSFPDNSVLYAGVCHSLEKSHSLAKKLHDKNLGYYIGWTNETPTSDAKNFAYAFVENLLAGKSVSKSIDDVPDSYKSSIFYNSHQEVSKKDEVGTVFLFPTTTIKIDQSKATTGFNNSKSVEVEGYTTSLDLSKIKCGFIYSTNEDFRDYKIVIDNNPQQLLQPFNYGNVIFRTYLTDLEYDKTYYYRAFTNDGENFNWGKRCSFETDKQEDDAEKILMISRNVNGVDYCVYKKNTDMNDYHSNPDGWKTYRSQLILETSKNGNKTTTIIDNNIYLDEQSDHHGGQVPCMFLDFNTNRMYVFCNSKDSSPNYSMDGYAYVSNIDKPSFKREVVFSGANWGWYPFFQELNDGSVTVDFFSYAGYYAMRAIRESDGSWALYRGGQISPADYAAMQAQYPAILVRGQ